MANEQLKTLEDKLSYAYDTKVAIHDAIVAKGIDIPEGTVFRDYASKIGEIVTGGGQCVITNGNYDTLYVVKDGESVETTDNNITVDKNSYVFVKDLTDPQYYGKNITGSVSTILEQNVRVGSSYYYYMLFFVYGDCSITFG